MRFVVKYKQSGPQVRSLSTVIDQASKPAGVHGRIDAPLLVRPAEVVHVTAELLRFVELFTFLWRENLGELKMNSYKMNSIHHSTNLPSPFECRSDRHDIRR